MNFFLGLVKNGWWQVSTPASAATFVRHLVTQSEASVSADYRGRSRRAQYPNRDHYRGPASESVWDHRSTYHSSPKLALRPLAQWRLAPIPLAITSFYNSSPRVTGDSARIALRWRYQRRTQGHGAHQHQRGIGLRAPIGNNTRRQSAVLGESKVSASVRSLS